MIFIHPIDIPNMKTGMIAPKCIWNKAKITLVIKIDFLEPYFEWNLFNRKPLNKISSDIGAIKIATVQKNEKRFTWNFGNRIFYGRRRKQIYRERINKIIPNSNE